MHYNCTIEFLSYNCLIFNTVQLNSYGTTTVWTRTFLKDLFFEFYHVINFQYDFPWGEHQHTEVEGIVHSQHVPCLSSDNTQYPLDKMPVRLIQAEACLDRGDSNCILEGI